MLYKKNTQSELSAALFENPTSEYRCTPFWAWNCELNDAELRRQIDVFKQMGFGGFHMHVRTGLVTPYLSDEYMDRIKSCVEKAKSEEMLAWLYDEDRWPSGAAGGLVTKDEQFRARYLLFTTEPYRGSADTVVFDDSSSRGGRTGNGKLLAVFDVILSEDGYLEDYRMISADGQAKGQKWYAYLEVNGTSPWYNGQTYVNTLDKRAIERFVEVTHERYKQCVGEDFGGVVPAIFTDEPQFTRKDALDNSLVPKDVVLPWTDDLEDTYQGTYGDGLTEHLPELLWEMRNKTSVTRYRYHDHIAERFSQAFADTIGAWCRKNGLMLTGHMMEEPTLHSQTAALGEAMRSYRGFDLPGIDMLCAWFELTTAKQAQSAAHQFGREGVLSELYGVTGWSFDFRGHKLHGDWQAALGVTVRVPHLSWVSMAGEAKRDYPASLSYQSPWYTEYKYVENHFARVNTAMTRGKPIVKAAVIHPVESYWLHWGPNDKTAVYREQLDDNFRNLTDWLLKGSIDFDFISESLLPMQCKKGGAPFKVGEMEYDAVIVPACETLRSTTLERLEAFREAGGKLIFMGSAPTLENAEESPRGKNLADKSLCIPFARVNILSALDEERVVDIRFADGRLTDNLIHSLRRDGEDMWIFISHAEEPYNKDLSTYRDITVSVKGNYSAQLYDTVSGEITALPCTYSNGKTCISRRLYSYDSLLIKYTPGASSIYTTDIRAESSKSLSLPDKVPFTLSEENILLLDMAEYRFDNGEWNAEDEILRLDNVGRKKFGWPPRGNSVAQPWTLPEQINEHTVSLRFTVKSDIDAENVFLALEDAEKAQITLNGAAVNNEICGWFTDKSIKKVRLGTIQKGTSIIVVTVPYGIRTNTEWCYLLGNFGVEVSGRCKKLIAMPETLAFADIVNQGLPFYGANITYHFNIEASESASILEVTTQRYHGALVKVELDGKDTGRIIYPPYELRIENVDKGKHTLDITLFTHRSNCFSAVHLSDVKHLWHGPDAWRSTGDRWSYEYNLLSVGLLTKPEVSEIR